jgi:hypothetical protein
VLLLLLCSHFKGNITKLILTVLPCADVILTHNTWHAFSDQMLSVKKEFIKSNVYFIKGAIEQDSVVPSSLLASVTQVLPVNSITISDSHLFMHHLISKGI